MERKAAAIGLLAAAAVWGQTQVDTTRQLRNALPYTQGGTSATTQSAARANVGTPKLVATDFAGADIGAKVNAAFASFGAGNCGTVIIPRGSYTYSTTIYIPTGCILEGVGWADAGIGGEGTRLTYNGAAATTAIMIGTTEVNSSSYVTIRDLVVHTSLSTPCPNDGMLAWNSAASGANKWQCYDGVTFTAPVVHLAGIRHGHVDPNVLSDGIFNRISNVHVNGGGTNWPQSQGAFHFGFWLNGCEECVLDHLNADGCDDGYSIGVNTNGVLGLMLTGRLNRRSGFHYRGTNRFQCEHCLFESNNNARGASDPTQHGAGIRASQEYTSTGSTGVEFIGTYFEANTVDLFGVTSGPFATNAEGSFDFFHSVRARFGNAVLRECTIPDGTLVSTSANIDLTVGCQVTGELSRDLTSRVIYKNKQGTVVERVWRNTGSGIGHYYYELPNDGSGDLRLRSEGPFGANGLRLENSTTANSVNNMPSATLRWSGSKWTGSATPYNWTATARANGTSSFLQLIDNTSAAEFKFTDTGAGQGIQWQAKMASPTAAVQSGAGTGATCAVDGGFGVSSMSGQLTLTTGSGAWASGAQCVLTFASTLSGWVTLTPANAAAAAAMNSRQVFVDRGTSAFSIHFGAADSASTTYKFNWHAIGNY